MADTYYIDTDNLLTIDKDPNAVLDYVQNWATWLAEVSDTITGTPVWTVGAGLTKDEYRAWRAAGESMRSDPEPRAKVPEYPEMKRGGFVGIVRIVDCTQHPIYDRDPAKNVQGWRMGSDEHGPTYGYDLADATPLWFVPARGALGIYNVEHRPNREPTPYMVDFGSAAGQYMDAYRRLEAKR